MYNLFTFFRLFCFKLKVNQNISIWKLWNIGGGPFDIHTHTDEKREGNTMDSESQNNANPIENATTSDHTTNDEHNQQQPTSESSTDHSNIVDLIGNGQLVKKVCEPFRLINWTNLNLKQFVKFVCPRVSGINSRTRWFPAAAREHLQNKFSWQIGGWHDRWRSTKLQCSSWRCGSGARCRYGNPIDDRRRSGWNFCWIKICVRCTRPNQRKR